MKKQTGGWVCPDDDCEFRWENDGVVAFLDLSVFKLMRHAKCNENCKPIKVMVKIERVGR